MAAYGDRGVGSGSSGARSERAAAGSGTGFTTHEAAFRKPSLRRNRFSKNLHFGGICGISPLFHHMFSRNPDLERV